MIWEIENCHRNGVISIQLGRSKKFFVSGGSEGEVRVWETKTREMISHLKEHTNRVTKIMLMEPH
jgi:WD40 repeat protein